MNKQGQQEWWGVEAEGCGGWFCWFYVLVFCWFCRFFVADSVNSTILVLLVSQCTFFHAHGNVLRTQQQHAGGTAPTKKTRVMQVVVNPPPLLLNDHTIPRYVMTLSGLPLIKIANAYENCKVI